MKCKVLLSLLFLVSLAQGQSSYFRFVAGSVSSSSAINLQNSGSIYHQISFTKTGIVLSCTVAVDSSADGVSWSAGAIITGQTCTSNGDSLPQTHVVANYMRVNVTAFTGGGSVTVVYTGYTTAASGGGTVTNVTASAPITSTGGATPNIACPTCGAGGTVTSFSAGTLSPLFTTSVATATTTPALSFSLTNAAAGTVFGNATASAAGPTFTAAPVLGVAGTIGTLSLKGNTSGTALITPQAAAGTPTLTLPSTTGTLVSAGTTNQVDVSATTGVASLSSTLVAPGTVTATTSVASPFFVSTNADPADAGAIRLGNGELIAWEASPASTDVTLTANSLESIVVGPSGVVLTSGAADILNNSGSSGMRIGSSQGNISSTAYALGTTQASSDVRISRLAAGIITIDNSTTLNNRGGIVLAGNSVFVASNFTTSGVGTALENITGLAWTFPATAANYNFHCHIGYSQSVGTAAVAFGIKATTNNPTNIFAAGEMYTAAGTVTTGVLATLATTTATNIVSGTPGGTGTNLPVDLYGTLELPASAVTINLMTSTATAADTVTVLRGSYCSLTP